MVASAFMEKLLRLVDFIHMKGVMHRDIKPDNIMLEDASLLPILIDFDLSENIDAEEYRNPFCGTPGYIAP